MHWEFELEIIKMVRMLLRLGKDAITLVGLGLGCFLFRPRLGRKRLRWRRASPRQPDWPIGFSLVLLTPHCNHSLITRTHVAASQTRRCRPRLQADRPTGHPHATLLRWALQSLHAMRQRHYRYPIVSSGVTNGQVQEKF
jgi:hypothetical protein